MIVDESFTFTFTASMNTGFNRRLEQIIKKLKILLLFANPTKKMSIAHWRKLEVFCELYYYYLGSKKNIKNIYIF